MIAPEFYILIAIIFILYWGFSQARRSKSSTERRRPVQTRQHFPGEKSEEEQDHRKWEKQKKKENLTAKAEPAGSKKPVSSSRPRSKRQPTEWQKAWIAKEILDPPRALRPYRFRQPR